MLAATRIKGTLNCELFELNREEQTTFCWRPLSFALLQE
jgi:hypothetical protein